RSIAVAVLVALAACRAPAIPLGSVTATRTLRPGGLCEDVYTLLRPPLGRFDRVNARRLARCDTAGGREPIVLYLPGMHMNGVLPPDPTPDFRREPADDDVRVWSVEYRTHAVPADAEDEELEALVPWTADVFADDVEALVAIVRTVDQGPLYVAGFSFGAGLA